MRLAVIVLLTLALIGGCAWWFVVSHPDSDSRAGQLRFDVVAAFPHDDDAFTQGLTVDGEFLLEGTGKRGKSELRRVDIETGKVVARAPLPADCFGEGVTIVDDQIIQLTWKKGLAFIYDRKTLKRVKTIRYEGQGWGITYDGKQLITSDGTSALAFRNVSDFRIERRVKVEDGGYPVSQLNELEFIDGRIWANVWYRDEIAVIEPQHGSVVAWLDLSSIRPASSREAVLNGIAYDPPTRRLFVTGKNWPKLFEIKVAWP